MAIDEPFRAFPRHDPRQHSEVLAFGCLTTSRSTKSECYRATLTSKLGIVPQAGDDV